MQFEKPCPSKQTSHCDVEESSKMCDTCKNDVVISVKKHSMEIDPQVFQVVKEKPSLVSFQEREQKLIRHCACQKRDETPIPKLSQ